MFMKHHCNEHIHLENMKNPPSLRLSLGADTSSNGCFPLARQCSGVYMFSDCFISDAMFGCWNVIMIEVRV